MENKDTKKKGLKIYMEIIEYKTSDDWNKIFKYKIIDPDGWRFGSDFNYNWYEEEITKNEFVKRVMESTIQLNKEDYEHLERE